MMIPSPLLQLLPTQRSNSLTLLPTSSPQLKISKKNYNTNTNMNTNTNINNDNDNGILTKATFTSSTSSTSLLLLLLLIYILPNCCWMVVEGTSYTTSHPFMINNNNKRLPFQQQHRFRNRQHVKSKREQQQQQQLDYDESPLLQSMDLQRHIFNEISDKFEAAVHHDNGCTFTLSD